ncbi:hypothetical protein NEMBOFW57_010287 [Staphylotrichum longicolle]|uniref:Uncharacterized protein n=1 Tax=Staphylotrichum longicolle TaxID=669026 RepID=A0AAD4EMT7_9PEZI|nr:hypothetical protein NEMBOFW57_010287 [Staphylotrichum longicolle]
MNFTTPFPSNTTNCTFHLPDENGSSSGDNTLSAGSAAFITIALIFGCMTQLPGSLVTGEGNRFWRISPFLCIAETATIFVRVVTPVVNALCTLVRRHLVPERFAALHLDASERQGRVSVKVAAFALLAERLGNSRRYNYWLRQQWKDAAPTVEQIVALLDEVSRLERGTTLRPIVIIPMVLQFAKLMIVDGDWIGVKLLPWVYFWSWFSVEFLLLMVHGDGLSEMEMLEAEKILLLSVAPTEVVTPKGRGAGRRTATPAVETTPSSSAEPRPSSADLERQDHETEVAAQSHALLARAVGSRNVPRNRISFRRGRVKLSTITGTASKSFWQMLTGTMAVHFEAMSTIIFISIAGNDHIPTWAVMILSGYSRGGQMLDGEALGA